MEQTTTRVAQHLTGVKGLRGRVSARSVGGIRGVMRPHITWCLRCGSNEKVPVSFLKGPQTSRNEQKRQGDWPCLLSAGRMVDIYVWELCRVQGCGGRGDSGHYQRETEHQCRDIR